jgi:hypothetical protein
LARAGTSRPVCRPDPPDALSMSSHRRNPGGPMSRHYPTASFHTNAAIIPVCIDATMNSKLSMMTLHHRLNGNASA